MSTDGTSRGQWRVEVSKCGKEVMLMVERMETMTQTVMTTCGREEGRGGDVSCPDRTSWFMT